MGEQPRFICHTLPAFGVLLTWERRPYSDFMLTLNLTLPFVFLSVGIGPRREGRE